MGSVILGSQHLGEGQTERKLSVNIGEKKEGVSVHWMALSGSGVRKISGNQIP